MIQMKLQSCELLGISHEVSEVRARYFIDAEGPSSRPNHCSGVSINESLAKKPSAAITINGKPTTEMEVEARRFNPAVAVVDNSHFVCPLRSIMIVSLHGKRKLLGGRGARHQATDILIGTFRVPLGEAFSEGQRYGRVSRKVAVTKLAKCPNLSMSFSLTYVPMSLSTRTRAFIDNNDAKLFVHVPMCVGNIVTEHQFAKLRLSRHGNTMDSEYVQVNPNRLLNSQIPCEISFVVPITMYRATDDEGRSTRAGTFDSKKVMLELIGVGFTYEGTVEEDVLGVIRLDVADHLTMSKLVSEPFNSPLAPRSGPSSSKRGGLWEAQGVSIRVVLSEADAAAAKAAKATKASVTAITTPAAAAAAKALATSAGVPETEVSNVIAWGTGVADVSHATVGGKWALKLTDSALPAAAPLSAAATADAIIAHMKAWALGSGGEWVSMGVPAVGDYGMGEGFFYSVPVVCEPGAYKRVGGVTLTPEVATMMEKERQAILGGA